MLCFDARAQGTHHEPTRRNSDALVARSMDILKQDAYH
jgi:hypothetical protein